MKELIKLTHEYANYANKGILGICLSFNLVLSLVV